MNSNVSIFKLSNVLCAQPSSGIQRFQKNLYLSKMHCYHTPSLVEVRQLKTIAFQIFTKFRQDFFLMISSSFGRLSSYICIVLYSGRNSGRNIPAGIQYNINKDNILIFRPEYSGLNIPAGISIHYQYIDIMIFRSECRNIPAMLPEYSGRNTIQYKSTINEQYQFNYRINALGAFRPAAEYKTISIVCKQYQATITVDK